MHLFRWISVEDIPAPLDLRELGWTLVSAQDCDDAALRCPVLAHAGLGLDTLGAWRFVPLRALVLLAGEDDTDARAQLLRLGFGDALGSSASLREIEARALRIADSAAALPRLRQFGLLRLDLFLRDAFVGQRRLGLHPREFALLWRLSDTPGQPVEKKALFRDVWRMAYVPETNSLAVHVYRLRSRLAAAGLDCVVRTAPGGGYMFEPAANSGHAPPFMLSGAESDQSQFALSVIQGLTEDAPQ